MKRKFSWKVLLLFLVLSVGFAMAARYENLYLYKAHVNTLYLGSGEGTAVTSTAAELNIMDGVTSTYAELNLLDGTQAYREMQLQLMSFSTNGADITSSTAPGLEVDDLVPAVVWADGETTPAQITFVVPPDYGSTPTFKVFATESDSTTPNEVDFSVYVNADGLAADSSATNQTPVALDGVTSTGTMITLTVATDFASLTAGQVVTLNIWRDDTAAGTGDLEVKAVVFRYSTQ